MTDSNSVKAIIADDHPLFRAALTQAVGASVLTGELVEAQDFQRVTELVNQLPDVELIFLDLNMPGSDGFSGLTQLRNTHPDILVIIVSALEEENIIRKAIDLGASAYIPKSASLSVITLAIEHVLNGEVWTPEGFDYTAALGNEQVETANKLEKLSPAQFKVLQMIADGLLNKQIAYELNVQETTVKQHVTAILQKLEVTNRTQAGVIFQQLKQIS